MSAAVTAARASARVATRSLRYRTRRTTSTHAAASLPLPPAGTTLSSPTNPFIKACVRLRDSRAARVDTGAMLITGGDLVAECCGPGGGATARAVVLLADTQPPPRLACAAAAAGRTLYASPAVLTKLAGVSNADGGGDGGAVATSAAAVVDAPTDAEWLLDSAASPPPPRDPSFRRILALDGVQDPGNVGTLARAALALGWDGLLLLPGCADPHGPRVLRAARGAVFRLPHSRARNVETATELADRLGLALVAAEVGASSHSDPAVPPTASGALLILGAERRGVSPALSAVSASVAIPMAVGAGGEGDAVESFNVATAGALLMAALTPGVGKSLARALYGEE